MRRKAIAAGVVVLVVVAGAALASGTLGPGATSGTDVETFPTQTPGSSTGDETAAEPFGIAVDRVERCGRTCRDVTTTLTNEQDATADEVTVYTRIYAGNGTDGDVVWENRRRVGTLEGGESVTVTERVSLSVRDGLKVRNNDGWVTVQTTIQSADETMTVTERRDVA